MSGVMDTFVMKLVSDINSPYTACYCEENIYLACQRLIESTPESLQHIFAVFVSNSTQTVLLWEQRASRYPPETGRPVVWDYHVIIVLVVADPENLKTLPDRIYVVDFDSVLGTLSSWKDYVSRTFHPELFEDGSFKRELQSSFRVVPAPQFIAQFASDRSHMKVEGLTTEYKMPPPAYSPIVGAEAKIKGVSNNLMNEYVCMTEEGATGSMILSMDGFLTLNWLNIYVE